MLDLTSRPAAGDRKIVRLFVFLFNSEKRNNEYKMSLIVQLQEKVLHKKYYPLLQECCILL